MSRDIAPFGVRMPADLKNTLETKAKANGRSLNAEVVDRLEESISMDNWHNSDKGYSFTLIALEEAVKEADRSRDQLNREYGHEQFDAMKDEILEAVKQLKEHLQK
ncbi:Arc family DNA-binding protein [Paralysiella testudinis]|uniref:Arc family DNA-binding protein n=1 Tax=Paralysiella testudinis TaxID=2809020 RepID=A0A892ZCK6_9NEIS|nr:Arc family DNA-binding protein [Paralysiella testudinis]QRQ80672.1 Arc family DNA-binding protein [Paralysiella testudinis]